VLYAWVRGTNRREGLHGVFEVLTSVNMLSSLDVNWYPHSVFSFTSMLRSASSETLRLSLFSKRLERCIFVVLLEHVLLLQVPEERHHLVQHGLHLILADPLRPLRSLSSTKREMNSGERALRFMKC